MIAERDTQRDRDRQIDRQTERGVVVGGGGKGFVQREQASTAQAGAK